MGTGVEQIVLCGSLETLKELDPLRVVVVVVVVVIACAVYEEAPRLLAKIGNLVEGRSGV
jgi:hypothetical protein